MGRCGRTATSRRWPFNTTDVVAGIPDGLLQGGRIEGGARTGRDLHHPLREIDLNRFSAWYCLEPLLDSLGTEGTHHAVDGDPVKGGASQGKTVAETGQPEGEQWQEALREGHGIRQ